jgi:hypothetical protein
MNLETTRLRGRPRNRWQDKVTEDGRSSRERQGIIAFCTCQWNEWCNLKLLTSQQQTKRGYKREREKTTRIMTNAVYFSDSDPICTACLWWCGISLVGVLINTDPQTISKMWLSKTHVKITCTHTAVCHDVSKFNVINCGKFEKAEPCFN